MKEIVKQLCKDQGVTLIEIAAKIGIARESLTRALDGNPTLSTIQGIASALGVQPCELFSGSGNSLNGFVEYNGTVSRIKTVDDLENLLKLVKDEI